MQIIIAPAKKMITDDANFLPLHTPLYLNYTEQIFQAL